MNCIKDGKLTGITCFGCEINQKECDICELLNKQRPKKVTQTDDFTVYCPVCKEEIGNEDNYLYDDYLKYCENCGQALSWEV